MDYEKAYEEHRQKIRELGGLILFAEISHEQYTKESLDGMKGVKMSREGVEARKRLGDMLFKADEIIKYLRDQYP